MSNLDTQIRTLLSKLVKETTDVTLVKLYKCCQRRGKHLIAVYPQWNDDEGEWSGETHGREVISISYSKPKYYTALDYGLLYDGALYCLMSAYKNESIADWELCWTLAELVTLDGYFIVDSGNPNDWRITIDYDTGRFVSTWPGIEVADEH